MKVLKSPTAVVTVGNSSSTNKKYAASNHSLFTDNHSSSTTSSPAIANGAIKGRMNSSSVISSNVSYGPSVEEVAAVAASITIADIENSNSNASMSITPAPLFVMSPKPKSSPAQKIVSPSFSPKFPLVLPPSVAMAPTLKKNTKVTGISSSMSTINYGNSQNANVAQNKTLSHQKAKPATVSFLQCTSPAKSAVPVALNNVTKSTSSTVPIPKYTGTLPNQSMTQQHHNKPIILSSHTAINSRIMQRTEHSVSNPIAKSSTHLNTLPQDQKIHNEEASVERAHNTSNSLQETNNISQGCRSMNAQDNLQTKPQHYFNLNENINTESQSTLTSQSLIVQNHQRENIPISSAQKSATSAAGTTVQMNPNVSQSPQICIENTAVTTDSNTPPMMNDESSLSTSKSTAAGTTVQMNTNVSQCSQICIENKAVTTDSNTPPMMNDESSISTSKSTCTVTTNPPSFPAPASSNSDRSPAKCQSTIALNPLSCQSQPNHLNTSILASSTNSSQLSTLIIENQRDKTFPVIQPAPLDKSGSKSLHIKPLNSPLVKLCNDQNIQPDSKLPLSQNLNNSPLHKSLADGLPSSGKLNKLTVLPASNTQTNTQTESRTAHVVSSCGSSSQTSPAVSSAFPVGQVGPMPQYAPPTVCDIIPPFRNGTATRIVNPKVAYNTRDHQDTNEIKIQTNCGTNSENGISKQNKTLKMLGGSKPIPIEISTPKTTIESSHSLHISIPEKSSTASFDAIPTNEYSIVTTTLNKKAKNTSQTNLKPKIRSLSFSEFDTKKEKGNCKTEDLPLINSSNPSPMIESRSDETCDQPCASFTNFEAVGISFQQHISSILDDYMTQKIPNDHTDGNPLISYSHPRPCLLQQSRVCDLWQEEVVAENSSNSTELEIASEKPNHINDHSFGKNKQIETINNKHFETYQNTGSSIQGTTTKQSLDSGLIVYPQIQTVGNFPLVSGTAAELLSRSKKRADKISNDIISKASDMLDSSPLVEGTAAAQIIATKQKGLITNVNSQYKFSIIKRNSHGGKSTQVVEKTKTQNKPSSISAKNHMYHALKESSTTTQQIRQHSNGHNVWESHNQPHSMQGNVNEPSNRVIINCQLPFIYQTKTTPFNSSAPDSTKTSTSFEKNNTINQNASSLKYGRHTQALPSISRSSESVQSDQNNLNPPKAKGMNMLADIISHAPPIISTSKQNKASMFKQENGTSQILCRENVDYKQPIYNHSKISTINQQRHLEHRKKLINPPPIQYKNPPLYHQNGASFLQQHNGVHSNLTHQHSIQFKQSQQHFLKRESSNPHVKVEMAPIGNSRDVFSQTGGRGSMKYKLANNLKVVSNTFSKQIPPTRDAEPLSCFTVGKIRRYNSAVGGFSAWESLTCQSFEGSHGRRWCDLNIDECREILLRRSGRLRIFPNFLTESKRSALASGMTKLNDYRQYKKDPGRNNLYPDPRMHVMLCSKADPNENHCNKSDFSNSGDTTKPLSLVPEVQSLAKDIASIYRLPNEEWNIGVDLVVYKDPCVGTGWCSNESKGDYFSLCIVTESDGGPLPVLIRLNKKNRTLEDGDEEIELWLNEGDAYEMDGCCEAGYEHCLPKQKADGMKRSLLFLRHGSTEEGSPVQDSKSKPRIRGGKVVTKSQTVHFGHPKRQIMEGKAFYSKEFLFETGAHMLDQRGLNGNLREGCDCLLLSKIKFNLREEDGLCWLLYTTSRALGGGALCRSFQRKKPIRVFRSSQLENPYAPQTKEEGRIAYRYDGLYSVRVMWDNEGNETNDFPPVGTSLHTFLLTRHTKMPFDGITEPGMYYNTTGVQELWNEIQKSQGVKGPCKFDIPQPPVILPSISKCKQNKGKTNSTGSFHKTNSSLHFKNMNRTSSRNSRRPENLCLNRNGQESDATSSSSESCSEDESDRNINDLSDSESEECNGSESEMESGDNYSVDSFDDKSDVSVGSSDEVYNETEKNQVTDSDCSNGRPKRASATAARSFLQEVMQKRNGDIHEGRKSPVQKSLIDSKKSYSNTKKKRMDVNLLKENIESTADIIGSNLSLVLNKVQHADDRINSDTSEKIIDKVIEDSERTKTAQNNMKRAVASDNDQSVSKDKLPENDVAEKNVAKSDTGKADDQSSMENLLLEETKSNADMESDSDSDSPGVDVSSLSIGSRVFVEYRDILYKATIRKSRIKNGKQDFSIHYDGNKKSNVHWISALKIYDVITDEPDKKKKGKVSKKSKKSKKPAGQKNSISISSKPSNNKSDESCDIISKFSIDSAAYVDYKHVLYLATVKDMRKSTNAYEYLVHYNGYKKTSDRWVQESQLHSITATSTRRFNKLRSEKGDNLNEELDLSDEENTVGSKRKQEDTPKEPRLDMGDIDSGVAFLPGSCVFVEKKDALYLSKMLKRRRRGHETEYFVEYDYGDSSENASESWVSLSNVYEINPRTRRIFEKTSNKRKLNQEEEELNKRKKFKGNSVQRMLIDMGDIPSGVVFLPGSTLFVLSEKGLQLAKMLKKRGRGNDVEYYIQYNGKDANPNTWISVSRVYEINPQTKRIFNKQKK